MSQRIGNLPANINIMNPVPNKDAKTIMKLIRRMARFPATSFRMARCFPRRTGVALAKQGGIPRRGDCEPQRQ